MNESFLVYHEPVFRPPSEANSVILQVTLGCKWNKCTFCEMYRSKKYSVKPLSTIKKEILLLSALQPLTNRIFIGDGDLFSVDFKLIIQTLELLKASFRKLKRVSAYASSRELLKFTPSELSAIKNAGLSLLYIGIESGDDEVLKFVNKGVTSKEQKLAILKSKNAGFKISVMILNGLGGKIYSEQHAIRSAELLNAVQPDLLALLVVSFPYGFEHFQIRMKGSFYPLSQLEMLKEMRLLLSHVELNSTVFRSDHASNYLVFKGGLNRDKAKFIAQLDDIITHTIHVPNPHLNETTNL